jgi:hypothetical protein
MGMQSKEQRLCFIPFSFAIAGYHRWEIYKEKKFISHLSGG